jgi:hypothetical protein
VNPKVSVDGVCARKGTKDKLKIIGVEEAEDRPLLRVQLLEIHRRVV